VSALRLFKLAARMGSPEAQVNLANLYDDGSSQSDAFARARYWYKRAWRSGLAEGAYNLAISYRQRGFTAAYDRWLLRAGDLSRE
jgi:TPR repeat protein